MMSCNLITGKTGFYKTITSFV